MEKQEFNEQFRAGIERVDVLLKELHQAKKFLAQMLRQREREIFDTFKEGDWVCTLEGRIKMPEWDNSRQYFQIGEKKVCHRKRCYIVPLQYPDLLVSPLAIRHIDQAEADLLNAQFEAYDLLGED